MDTEPCCGACGHAAEVARQGGAAPNDGPHLAVPLDAGGAPSGVSLVLTGRGGEPQVVPVRKGRIVLGRTPPADVVVSMDVLSRRQCAFDFSNGTAVVEDLQSVCGTFVNGESIDARALRAGDEVRVGDLVIHVRVGGEP